MAVTDALVSVLRSAEAPDRQLWVSVKVGLNVGKVNLELGLDPEDDETAEEAIIPLGMLKNIGPVDKSRKLFKRIRKCENVRIAKLRVHDLGCDWHLSPHILSKKLVNFLKALPSNQGANPAGVFVIAYSLGGVITRHAENQAPLLFSGVIYDDESGDVSKREDILAITMCKESGLVNVCGPHSPHPLIRRTTFRYKHTLKYLRRL